MCFRPAGAAKAIKCPDCGTFNKPGNSECQKCGRDFSDLMTEAPAVTAPGAPGNAPAAPGNAPVAPGNAPVAPGGPKKPPVPPKPPAPKA
jgi:DNA-directed RNA polymerase subunit RPC12/RpoP